MILVTGGAGFIGSNFIAGWESERRGPVAVCDRLDAPEKWRNIAKRTLADFVLPEQLFDWLRPRAKQLDAIVHLGAISATTASDGAAVLRTNIRLSLDLWEWCALAGVRLIYASSAAVYGDGAEGFDDDPSPEALARLRPLNLYGWSKLFVDRRVGQMLAERAPAPPQWAGLRFFNVYGPNEYHKTGQLSIATGPECPTAGSSATSSGSTTVSRRCFGCSTTRSNPGCSISAAARPTVSRTWPRRRSARLAGRGGSITSTCRQACGRSISILPRRRSRGCVRPAIRGR
jgi:NAD dependent epimerase/dehydratase family